MAVSYNAEVDRDDTAAEEDDDTEVEDDDEPRRQGSFPLCRDPPPYDLSINDLNVSCGCVGRYVG